MGKTIKYLIGCVVILMLAACSSQELLGEATPEITTPSPVVPTETSTPTPTLEIATMTPTPLYAFGSPMKTILPPLSSSELATYRNEVFHVQFNYPAEWQEISEGVYAGEDGGYMIIKKFESNKYLGASIYAVQNYAEYDPYILCGPYTLSPGCDIMMTGPDIFGNEISKVVSILGYSGPDHSVVLFTLEMPAEYYKLIYETMANLYVYPESQSTGIIAMTATEGPTPVPYPRQLNLSNEGALTEVWWNDFEQTDEFNDARGLGIGYCGPESKELDSIFTIRNSIHGILYVYQEGELVYNFPSLDYMGYNYCTWEDNWMIESGGVVVVNGEILNYQFDMEEIFGWHLLGGKPLFFAVRNDRYYVVYDGEILPIVYDDIRHYGCCGAADYNPVTTGEATWFRARRDGVGYWVTISVDSD